MKRNDDGKKFSVVYIADRTAGEENEFGAEDPERFKKEVNTIWPNQLCFNFDDTNKVTKYSHFNWRVFEYSGTSYRCVTIEDSELSSAEKASIDQEMSHD
jgi:hypothetical protein